MQTLSRSTRAPTPRASSRATLPRHPARVVMARPVRQAAVRATAAALAAPRPAASAASRHYGRRLAVAAPGVRTAYRARARTAAVEANLFSRVFRLIRSTIDNFVGTFEDPERLLDRIVIEMSDDAVKLRQATAQVIASLRQLQGRQRNMQAQADQWMQRAELAVRSGQDELAKEALRRRKSIQAEADRIGQQAALQEKAADQLQANVRVLETRIAEARAKKETLKARAMSARTSQQIQELVGGLRSTSSSSFAAFEKMEEKVIALEAEVESTAALVAPDNLEQQFLRLEVGGGGGVDDELAALKRATAADAAARRPRIDQVLQRRPEPAAVFTEIDAELQALRERANRMS